jgi:hypothetical protein
VEVHHAAEAKPEPWRMQSQSCGSAGLLTACFRSAVDFLWGITYSQDNILIIGLIAECGSSGNHSLGARHAQLRSQKKRWALQKGLLPPDLMESMAHDFALTLRQAKMIIERAVKYSEAQNAEKVSVRINKALDELMFCGCFSCFCNEDAETEEVISRREAIGAPPEV